MHLEPLLSASPAIQVHAGAAFAALLLGVVQLATPKGATTHRVLGWLWALLMLTVALSSLLIHTICMLGPFSAIHLLSLFTLVMVPVAVWRARTHQVRAHRRAMLGLFTGALVIAGLFTLAPGRIMHDVLFGTHGAHYSCS